MFMTPGLEEQLDVKRDWTVIEKSVGQLVEPAIQSHWASSPKKLGS